MSSYSSRLQPKSRPRKLNVECVTSRFALRFRCGAATSNDKIRSALVHALNYKFGERNTALLSKIKFLVCANALFVFTVASAQAGVWDWTFVGSGSSPDFARGSLTTDASNVITSLTGVWDGETISLLAPHTLNFNDNKFTTTAPYVDAAGFAFSTPSAGTNKWINIFNLGSGGPTQEAVGPAGVSINTSSVPVTFTASPTAVPWEPSDVAVIAGVALFGFQRLRRKRQAA